MLKKISLLLAAFTVRFLIPLGLVTDWNPKVLFTEPTAGYSLLGIIVFGIIFMLVNKTFKGILEDKPKTHLGVFLYKELKALMFTLLMIGIFVFIATFSEALWMIAAAFGLCYIISEYLFYEYYVATE